MLTAGGRGALAPGRHHRRRRPRVVEHFLFDLDGTITRQEILPEIARAIGHEAEIAELTARTMAGEVPFESSLRRRVEILATVPISRVREIVAGIEVDPHIAAFLRENRERCTIVTGNLDVWIADLVAELGVPCRSSVARHDGDRLLGLEHVLDKADVAREVLGPLCAIGDGFNDLGLMAAAEFGVAYGGVHAPAPGLFEVATHAVYDPQRLCRLLSAL
jgi:HAD superfamily phosphoserine phosphatase-like hydrolase